MYNDKDVPCKNCTERTIGCHSECDKYKEFNEKRQKVREERRLQNSYINYLVNQWRK